MFSVFWKKSFSPFSDPTSILLSSSQTTSQFFSLFSTPLTSPYSCHLFSTPLTSSRLFLNFSHLFSILLSSCSLFLWQPLVTSSHLSSTFLGCSRLFSHLLALLNSPHLTSSHSRIFSPFLNSSHLSLLTSSRLFPPLLNSLLDSSHLTSPLLTVKISWWLAVFLSNS
jgi:hypothetical protein